VQKIGIDIKVTMGLNKLDEPRCPYSLPHLLIPTCSHLYNFSELLLGMNCTADIYLRIEEE
jgi:hypothetical protein